MDALEIKGIIERQRRYFASGATLPVSRRLEALARLKKAIHVYEAEILEALNEDLLKSRTESYMCEIGMTLSEITYMQKRLRRLARDKNVATPIAQFCARSYTKPVPYGTVLIMSPWNYPFLLTLEPLVDALAAGNTCVIKPSAYSPATAGVLAKIIQKCFDEKYVAIVNGGRQENQCLLEQKFDYIFFTGSQTVGKDVMKKAAQNLTPLTLELGGKSPCVVDETANLRSAARRIVFGKFLNCGQTCVAPDYLYCHESVKEELLGYIVEEICRQYGKHPLDNDDYGKIINKKHFERITGLIDGSKVVFGGTLQKDKLRVEPTILDNVTWDDDVMKEEIFGPILPVITFNSLEEVMSIINSKPRPLAAYFFSKNKENIRKFTHVVQFGGGCVNDTIIHLATQHMGFGGVGESGMGSYHGRAGFETFSHRKSIVQRYGKIEPSIRYQPYNFLSEKLIKMFLR